MQNFIRISLKGIESGIMSYM